MKKFLRIFAIICSIAGVALLATHLYIRISHGIFAKGTRHPIPNSAECTTQKDFFDKTHAWLRRHTVVAYQHTVRAGDQDPAAIEFLEKATHAVAYPTERRVFRSVAEQGGRLIAEGCNDPLVRLWYGLMLFHAKEMEQAEPQLMVAYDWSNNNYPDINAFLALRSLSSLTQRKKSHRPGEAKNHMGYALDRFCFSILGNEFLEEEEPIAYRLLDNTYSDIFDISKYAFVLKALESSGINDGWLVEMIRGGNELALAWEARGTGYAKKVSQKGWEQFAQHSDRACEILTAAWQSNPNRPEAASNMIGITISGHGNEGDTIRLWFDRAVAAQMDYPEAYREMISALRPRWGGSREEMREFGHECLATNRFDTDVPLFYLYALRKIGVEIENDRWRSAFRAKGEGPILDDFFEKLLAEPGRADARDRILTQYALVKAWSGDYRSADRLMGEVAQEVDLGDGFLGKTLSWSHRDRATVEAELLAFNGPYGDLATKAEKLELVGSIPEAVQLYEQAMQAYAGDSAVSGYLRDRIAILRMGNSAEENADPALFLAVRNKDMDVAAFLLANGADPNCENFYYKSPLHRAAADNDLAMAKLLLQYGADLNKRADGLSTPLHSAIKKGHMEMARFLIDQGADINAHDSGGWAALHLALYYKQPELAVICIDRGADVNAKADWGWPPLLHAVKHGFGGIARLLISKGARVNERTDNGWTPLHIMVWDGNEPMVRLLLEEGANAAATLPDGKTPIMIAQQRKFGAIEELLRQYE